MYTTDRRRFLAQFGSARPRWRLTSWLASFGYAQTRGPARAVIQQDRYVADLDRRLLGAFLEHLGRAIYTGVYEPDSQLRRRERLPQGRDRRDQADGRADHALPGRQFCFRLQLARRRRTEGQAADRVGAGLEFARNESVRHERIHRLVQAREDRAAVGFQLGHRHAGNGRGLCGVLQRRQRHQVERVAARARLRAAAQRARTGAWATKWTGRGRWAT